MIIYLCIKFQSNTPILSKDIKRKTKVLRTGQTDGTDVCTDSGDTICPPIENGGGIKKQTRLLYNFISIKVFLSLYR